MKNKFLLITFLLFSGSASFVFATDNPSKYKFDDIPKQLLTDAKAVVRNEEITVEIRTDEEIFEKVTYAITILNKNAEMNALFMQPYTPDMKLRNIKAKLYDKFGAEIKKKGGFDIKDYAMIPGGTTYADYRIKAISPEHFDYPFTIEYSYEMEYSNVIQFPGWHPVKDFNIAIENSTYILIVSNQANCRYYEKNILQKASANKNNKNTSYVWQIQNRKAVRNENFCPALDDFAPIVLIAPTKVMVDGYEGNFDSWAGIGSWIYTLNQDRNNLSEATKMMIKSMTDSIADDRTKIKLVYEYMQNKTRYVSVQVGIGGFQPFPSETVDRLSYGDCKALSFYIKSLLQAAGINSLYTLVMAGNEKPTTITDFPSNQFNHAIVCVPLKSDTLWLECTSQRIPFNYLGTFTADRTVLLITEKGGILAHTPQLLSDQNLQSHKAEIVMNPEGNARIKATTSYRGAAYDKYARILQSDKTDQKELLIKKIHLPNFELNNFRIQEDKLENPSVTEILELSLTSYCTKAGSKLMLGLNALNRMDESPFLSATRETPISIKWPVKETDTVNFTLPSGYTLEKLPSKIIINSHFGKYESEVTKIGNTIQYIRNLSISEVELPVNRYNEVAEFFDAIVTADQTKVVLSKTQ